MHDYLIKMPIHCNNELLGKSFDIDQFIKADKATNNDFQINDTIYTMFLSFSRLSDTSNRLILQVEFYDDDVNEMNPDFIKTLFDSEGQYIRWIKDHIELYINQINSEEIKIDYFDVRGEISFNKLYMPIYDFNTRTKLEIPEINQITIQLELPNIEHYFK
jgi:hypothetical protein